MLQSGKQFVFFHKYSFRDWSNNGFFIPHFSKSNEQFIIFNIIYCKL